MKYGQQVQGALNRLDNSLKKLHTMVKRGENANAIEFMERGELKDRYEDLQNIITLSGGPGSRGLGARGTIPSTGTF